MTVENPVRELLTGGASAGAWLQWLPATRAARASLVVFPHAGAGASAYRGWRELLPPTMELFVVRMPGREKRFSEPLATSLHEVAAAVATSLSQIRGDNPRPLGLFGHSMGALLAFATAVECSGRGCEPDHLFVSGHPPPTPVRQARDECDVSDAMIDHMLNGMGGTSEALLNNSEFMEMIRRVVRADVLLTSSYSCIPTAQLRMNLTAICGSDDEFTTGADMTEWAAYSSGAFSIEVIDGGHFFVLQNAESVIGRVMKSLGVLAPTSEER
jgi:surfactin synthase thioesterase subunit